MDPVRRLRVGITVFGAVIAVGTAGYLLMGFSPLDALYQTVTTVSTVGFREVEVLSGPGKAFTIVLILLGVGTALYTFGVLVEGLVEGQLLELLGRRRMERRIARLTDHVVVCGYGRVGRAIADQVLSSGRDVVVVDRDHDAWPGSPSRPWWATPTTTLCSSAPASVGPGCSSPPSPPTPTTSS